MSASDAGTASEATHRQERPKALLLRWTLVVLGGAAAQTAASIVLRVPGYYPWLSTAWSVAVVLVPGCAILLAGLLTGLRASGQSRRIGVAAVLLEAAGVLWFVAAWNDPAAGAWAFTAGRLTVWVFPLVAIHAALLCQGRLHRGHLAGLALGYLCTCLLAGLTVVLFHDPSRAGCLGCPGDPLLVADLPAMAGTASWVAVWGGIAWSATLLLTQLDTLLRWSPVRRRFAAPIAVCGIGLCVIVSLGYVDALMSTDAGPAQMAGGILPMGLAAALTLCAAAAAWPLVESRLIRIRLARLMAESAAAPPAAGGLTAALRRLLADPTAQLLYPITGHRLIGPDGNPADPPTGPHPGLTRIRRGSATVAYLAHQRTPLDVDGTVLEEITRATQLMLDSERLRAEHSWHLRQLQQSRRRIVAAADKARQEFERDLHDGAQQNLVSLAMALSVAQLRTSVPDRADVLHRAGSEVSNALVELRDIAHGIFPRELGDDGLDAALELLAESAASPIAVTGAVKQRLQAAVESAAYFAVRASLAAQLAGTAGAATISLRLLPPWPDPASPEWLIVDIETDTTPPELLAIEDRVGALGGRLTVRTKTTGTHLRVEVPCAS